jgi:hypothetical protein
MRELCLMTTYWPRQEYTAVTVIQSQLVVPRKPVWTIQNKEQAAPKSQVVLQRLATLPCCTALLVPGYCQNVNGTYNNPILLAWNSDPSCTFVPELDNTFFCTTSTFLVFPGIPVYANKDLKNWKLASQH